MRTIVRVRFGSHLYGTSTPQSDLDFKSVYIPDAGDILLQRVQGSINTARPKAAKEKNLPGEVEEESYSLQRYLALLAEGQTVALDLLFAPDWSMTETPSPEWRELVAHRGRLVTKRSAAFLRYCRQQANKYGIKGSRVAAARAALALLTGLVETHGTTAKLGEFRAEIDPLVAATEHTQLIDITLGSGHVVKHWDVCGRKLPFTASVKTARDVVQKLVDEYGQRALQAESQQGVDWKALSHAVRVGTQAIELLRTGHVTFPLPNAAHILDVKLGRLPYETVATEIEHLLEAVEAAAAASSLPDAPDLPWIDGFVSRVYRDEIVAGAHGGGLPERAHGFAAAAHAHQVRKYGGEPYLVHLAEVADMVARAGFADTVVAAAWLHDVVEDCDISHDVIAREFGADVRQLVWELTDVERVHGNRAQRKTIDRDRLAQAGPEAQSIKLADLISNATSIARHDPHFARKYLREMRDLLEAMTKGHSDLRARAWTVLRSAEEAVFGPLATRIE